MMSVRNSGSVWTLKSEIYRVVLSQPTVAKKREIVPKFHSFIAIC